MYGHPFLTETQARIYAQALAERASFSVPDVPAFPVAPVVSSSSGATGTHPVGLMSAAAEAATESSSDLSPAVMARVSRRMRTNRERAGAICPPARSAYPQALSTWVFMWVMPVGKAISDSPYGVEAVFHVPLAVGVGRWPDHSLWF